MCFRSSALHCILRKVDGGGARRTRIHGDHLLRLSEPLWKAISLPRQMIYLSVEGKTRERKTKGSLKPWSHLERPGILGQSCQSAGRHDGLVMLPNPAATSRLGEKGLSGLHLSHFRIS